MARMVFGPWVRPSQLALGEHEHCDATDFDGHHRWIPANRVFTASNNGRTGWRNGSGLLIEQPQWVRRRDWGEPADIEVPGSDRWNSVGLEHNQDGSVTVGFATEDQAGRITIPASQVAAMADWFTKAVEANKQ